MYICNSCNNIFKLNTSYEFHKKICIHYNYNLLFKNYNDELNILSKTKINTIILLISLIDKKFINTSPSTYIFISNILNNIEYKIKYDKLNDNNNLLQIIYLIINKYNNIITYDKYLDIISNLLHIQKLDIINVIKLYKKCSEELYIK